MSAFKWYYSARPDHADFNLFTLAEYHYSL